jgi:tRNA A37 methylthiotransferase MiaB
MIPKCLFVAGNFNKSNPMSKKRFFIAPFGCARRRVDAERIKNYFLANGVDRSALAEEADYLVVITCDLSKAKEETCIRCIQKFKKLKGKLVIYGCLPAMNPEVLATVYDGKTVITKEIDGFDACYPEFPVKFRDIADPNRELELGLYDLKILEGYGSAHGIQEGVCPAKPILIHGAQKRQRTGADSFYNEDLFALRISEGCLGSCSYCSIRKAIGRLKSKPVSLLISELREGITKRQYNINILASDTGSYGLDIGSSFPELLWSILNEDKRIAIEFIQDLNPHWICRYKEDFINLAKTGRIKSIIAPFQSGNSRVLKLMHRDLDLSEFRETINNMRKHCPGIKLGTQVIVGFPTETEEEYMDTVNYIKECKFNKVDIFAYYEVDGSVSKQLTPKVEPRQILDRAERMRVAVNTLS